jgi:hypothetical protein
MIYDEFLYIESIRLVPNWLNSDVARANLSDVATEIVAVMDCASSFQLTSRMDEMFEPAAMNAM